MRRRTSPLLGTTLAAAFLTVGAPARAENGLSTLGPASGGLSSGPAVPVQRAKVKTQTQRPLHIGIVAPARQEVALDRVEPFRRRMAATLGAEVIADAFVDERRLAEALATGRVDYARLTASGYATAWALCGCVEPLAAPRASDGTAGYRAAIVTKRDAPIKTIKDLSGRTLAASVEPALATRRLPLMALAQEGLAGDKGVRLVDVAGPEEAVRALVAGRAEAAIVWTTLEGDPTEGWGRGTLRDLAAKGAIHVADLRVVWSSPVLPHGPQAVRGSLDEGRKRRLRDMLVDLDEVDPEAYEAIEPAFGGGFLRIGHAAYGTWLKLVQPEPKPASEEPKTQPEGPGTTGAVPPG